MTAVFFALAVAGFVLTVNALRPLPPTSISMPSFFASWLTSELAPHHLVIHVVVVAAFVASGAVEGTRGAIALSLTVLTAGGLVALIVQSQRVRDVVERALCEGLGNDYLQRIIPPRRTDYDLRVPWRQLLLPFHMTHPDVVRIRNVQYGPYGRRNRLDVYHARESKPGAPILLQIHGGGWVIGNKDQQGRPIMLHFASRGWVCVGINYRLSPRASWPAHIEDCKAALHWIREHAAEYGADPNFVVVTGGSAGGHLAALLTLDEAANVQAAIPYYGVYDFTNTAGTRMGRGLVRFLERTVFKRTIAGHREDFVQASPLYRIREDAPPFLVIHGAHDSLASVKDARGFVRRLRETSRAPVVYAELPGAQHAFDVFPSIRTAHVIRAAERFADYVYSRYAELNAGRPSTP